MKTHNLFYLIIIPLAYVLFVMNSHMSTSSISFFGFAENKETELSYQGAVSIKRIHVNPGQEVKKGDLLLEADQIKLDYKIQALDHEIKQSSLINEQKKESLRNEIALLKAEKANKQSVISNEIQSLKANIELQLSLFEDLKSIDGDAISFEQSPQVVKLKALNTALELQVKTYNLKISQKKAALRNIDAPFQEEKKELAIEQAKHHREKKQMHLYAPEAGLIGNVFCKPGENVSPFSTLINFYEHRPTVVKGFVHETLIPKIEVGDSLFVSSVLHPELVIGGMVSGLGSRIVEIPERLRKLPEIKSFGREIIIQIPKKNPFLQKEKVTINRIGRVSTQQFISSLLF